MRGKWNTRNALAFPLYLNNALTYREGRYITGNFPSIVYFENTWKMKYVKHFAMLMINWTIKTTMGLNLNQEYIDLFCTPK